MKKIELQNITISDYCKMLRSGVDAELLEQISTLLNESLGKLNDGFDLSLFMLQKDLLIFQCKFAIAVFEFENDKAKTYEKKISELRKQIEKKAAKKEKSNPYKSFLSWILSVEKYLGFGIDKNNDLLYFVEATKQMLNYYEQQKQNIESNKVKK